MSLKQNLIERQEIIFLAEQAQPAIGAIEHVIDETAGSNASRTGHVQSLSYAPGKVKGPVPFIRGDLQHDAGIGIDHDGGNVFAAAGGGGFF